MFKSISRSKLDSLFEQFVEFEFGNLFCLGEPIYPAGGLIFECFRHLNVYLFIENDIDLGWWYASYSHLWTIS
mgnify:CR=1 FL=1